MPTSSKLPERKTVSLLYKSTLSKWFMISFLCLHQYAIDKMKWRARAVVRTLEGILQHLASEIGDIKWYDTIRHLVQVHFSWFNVSAYEILMAFSSSAHHKLTRRLSILEDTHTYLYGTFECGMNNRCANLMLSFNNRCECICYLVFRPNRLICTYEIRDTTHKRLENCCKLDSEAQPKPLWHKIYCCGQPRNRNSPSDLRASQIQREDEKKIYRVLIQSYVR